jgi:hypothetical protein
MLQKLFRSRLITRCAAGCAHGELDRLRAECARLEKGWEQAEADAATARVALVEEQKTRVMLMHEVRALTAQNSRFRTQLALATAALNSMRHVSLRTSDGLLPAVTFVERFVETTPQVGPRDTLIMRYVCVGGQPLRVMAVASKKRRLLNAQEKAGHLLTLLENLAMARRSGALSGSMLADICDEAEGVIEEIYVPIHGVPAGAIHFDIANAPEAKKDAKKELKTVARRDDDQAVAA